MQDFTAKCHKSADCLENYDVLEEIGNSQHVTTYLANSRGSKARSGAVVVRKCKGFRSFESHQHHRSLYHPAIVSVYSLFACDNASFQVVELCSGGSLADLLKSRPHKTLNEDEARGVMRGLADALLYLNKATIMHRTIRPSCVLFGTDLRVKLSGFDFATTFPSSDIETCAFDIAAQYIAPEIISAVPHNNATDIWSYGCLLFVCISGRHPFEGKIPSQIFESIISGKFTFPARISSPLHQLLLDTLTTDPERRISLINLAKSPFVADNTRHTKNPVLQFLSPLIRESNTQEGPFAHMRAEVSGLKTSRLARVVSEPTPRRRVTIGEVTTFPTGRRATFSSLTKNNVDEPSHTTQKASPDANAKQMHQNDKAQSSIVGNTRPIAISTTDLKPRTHKTITGQITILPSHSLLIDFREGERRKGQTGDQVLVVSHGGSHIDVFSAPRLSVPVCLVEPVSSYSLDSIPSDYWKPLNDAAELIERIKQRTTKLVSFEQGIRYSLMANGPPGDIELLFLSEGVRQEKTHDENVPNARLRIRLYRRTRTLEFSRRITNGSGGVEWTKRVLCTSPDFTLSPPDLRMLSIEESRAMSFLYQFLRVCDVSESGTAPPISLSKAPAIPSSPKRHSRQSLGLGRPSAMSRVLTGSSTTTKVFSDVELPPRPRKFSDTQSKLAPMLSESLEACQGTLSDVLKSFDIDPPLGFDSRFIPEVGWCLRHSSRVSQGGHFRILYLDGSMLEVDADEEWLRHTACNGVSSRHSIRRSPIHPLVVSQLRVFERVLSAFDGIE